MIKQKIIPFRAFVRLIIRKKEKKKEECRQISDSI